jgi:hypothetical protein
MNSLHLTRSTTQNLPSNEEPKGVDLAVQLRTCEWVRLLNYEETIDPDLYPVA